EREREREREGRSSPRVLAGATARQDVIKLVITINRSSRPSSCSSRQDEAVDTNRVAIGAWTKPYAPPEDSPLRAREFHAPPPDHRSPPQLRRRRRPTFRFGVHLSSWSSYIPLLFIAKVRPMSRSDFS
ncbi:unnamed protein product, partial [Brassica oleracea]